MANRDIIVIGASAGGLQALVELCKALPGDLGASIFVVVHVPADNPSMLAAILGRSGPLPVEAAEDGAEIQPGRIYVARADHHLLLKRGTIATPHGPKENSFRPAVDPLFRTAARAYGPRVIGIVLSGALDDGAYGLSVVKDLGGIAIVQDPGDALVDSMPLAAIRTVEADYILPIAAMAPVIVRLTQEDISEEADDLPSQNGNQHDVAEGGPDAMETGALPGAPSGFTCPECGGAIWELATKKLLRYRCHVGHAYNAESLLSEQTTQLEAVLWAALRALEENAALQRRMARRAKDAKLDGVADAYEKNSLESSDRAAFLRDVLLVRAVPLPQAKGR